MSNNDKSEISQIIETVKKDGFEFEESKKFEEVVDKIIMTGEVKTRIYKDVRARFYFMLNFVVLS